jgi:hypothetical protein
VHYVGKAQWANKEIRVVQVADVGQTTGIQRITYSLGARKGHETIIVSAGTAYIRGDAFTLVRYQGFRAPAAAKYADTWVQIPHTDSRYATVAADVTLPSAMATLDAPPGSPTALPNATIAGRRVVGVRWRETLHGTTVVTTLYARASGRPLPVEQGASRGVNGFTVLFSDWNESLKIAVPISSVPIEATGLE